MFRIDHQELLVPAGTEFLPERVAAKDGHHAVSRLADDFMRNGGSRDRHAPGCDDGGTVGIARHRLDIPEAARREMDMRLAATACDGPPDAPLDVAHVHETGRVAFGKGEFDIYRT